jgi:uncharacterized SAM-binding protein YcdF (DUF218 family)
MSDETPPLLHLPTGADDQRTSILDRRRDRMSSDGWSWRRRVVVGLLVVVALAFLYYLINLFQVMEAGRTNTPESADVIVVLGAAQYDGRPSPQLAARLDHALDLWNAGIAGQVMVTGGNRPGDRYTEAEASRAYLVERGVPNDIILSEGEGTTTYESLEAAAGLLTVAGLDRVVLVTDPYHSLRARLIADELGLDASVSPTPTSVVTGFGRFRRELVEAGGVAVGRIIGFDRLSGITG